MCFFIIKWKYNKSSFRSEFKSIGLQLAYEAKLNLKRAIIKNNLHAGVLISDENTVLNAEDLIVEDTQSIKDYFVKGGE